MTVSELTKYFSDRTFFKDPDQEVEFVLSPDDIPLEKARNSLEEDGRAQVDLHDGCCVSCVLYRDDTTNIKE